MSTAIRCCSAEGFVKRLLNNGEIALENLTLQPIQGMVGQTASLCREPMRESANDVAASSFMQSLTSTPSAGWRMIGKRRKKREHSAGGGEGLSGG
jgi:hypothetical protein